MQRWWAIVPVLAFAAACTSSHGGSTSSAPPSPTDPVSSATRTTVAPTTSSSPRTSSAPATPTVPADVPTTGPNTKPGEKPPVMPVAATQHTPAGAKAFAAFFIKTIDWAYATTSTTYMKNFYQPSCIACVSAANAIDRAAQKEHHFIGDRFTIKSVSGPQNLSSPTVVVQFDVTSVEVVDSKGNFVNADAAQTNFVELVNLAWLQGKWTVPKMVPK